MKQFELYEVNLEGQSIFCTFDGWSFKLVNDEFVYAIGFTFDNIDFHGFIGENYSEFEEFVKDGKCYQNERFKKKYAKLFDSVVELLRLEIENEEE